MMDRKALNWPALQFDTELPEQIAVEQGVWGKVHGSRSDFRWIATTPAFAGVQNHVERELLLGSEDAATRGTLWRALGHTCYAIGFYPSRARDAAGRTGFLEKQILEWKRPAGVPAALGALLLLPIAASLDDTNWWERYSDVRWSEEEREVEPLAAAPPLETSMTSIAASVTEGLRLLAESTSEDALTDLYATILADGRAIPLKGLTAPLPAAALAALLLPLPRTVADRLSIAGWLPSTRLFDDTRRCWDVILGGATPVGDSAAPTADQLRDARTMAKAVLAGNPDSLTSEAAQGVAIKPFEIALWGPSAAGKTAFVAKLFLDAEDDEDWEVFPTGQSLKFIKQMRERMRTKNQFPLFTVPGDFEGIEYVFTHRKSGMRSLLQLEDRAGRESELLEEEESMGGRVGLKKRLTSAGGLVLLFDPLADEAILEARVSDTLELLNVASGRIGRREERPIAVCVSKADVLIETPSDYRRAIEAPDEFVRERVPRGLVRPLDRYCSNYRLFPVSAAGVRLRHGIIEPAVFIDERLESRICPDGRPLNLMAPFSWILGQLVGSQA